MYERNGMGVEPVPTAYEGYSALEFGGRIHELLEEFYKDKQGIIFPPYPENPNPVLEAEGQLTYQAYRSHYPNEQLHIIDVERTFKVALPGGKHTLVGKMDLIVDNQDIIDIIDHKSQNRTAKSNTPQKWAARDQPSLYLWAAKRMFPDRTIGRFIVNVLVRQSDKGQVGPSFPERQYLERTQTQLEMAIRDIEIIADQIEEYRSRFGSDPWPANRENCYDWGPCPYWPLHGYGSDNELIVAHRYQPKTEYLHLAGIPIIQ
jgi:PD-(D/E)XK nuclease superfamily